MARRRTLDEIEEDLEAEDLGALFDQTGNERDRDPGIGDNSGAQPDAAIEALDFTDLGKMGRLILLQDLVKAVKQGYATPAEKNVLRQMLKDNGMMMGDPDAQAESIGQPRRKADLPEFEPPDYAGRRNLG